MDLYPAIDLSRGRCVRLSQGDFARERVYSDDPVAVARSFAAAGAQWVHVVDLDAARTGVPANRDAVRAVAAAVDIPVQCGGGVRSLEAAGRLLRAGVSRVVVGTAALSQPGLVEQLAERHPGQVAIGLDHRLAPGGRRELALRGWSEGSGRDLFEALAALEGSGAAAVVVTDISRDGMLEGPDLEGMAAVLAASALPVIASGGVSSAADLAELAGLAAGRRLSGVIVGRALYEGRVDVAGAVRACAASG